MAMLRAGKVRFELHPEGRVNGTIEEEESKVSIGQIGIQFSHEASSVTVDQENEVMEQLKRSGLKHSFWKKFGFQNTNPRTDWRASGILGLHQLYYFASKYPRVSKNLKFNISNLI